jgi:hypothetical protein
MIHNFITKAHDLEGLFNGVNRMSQFMRNLESQAQIDPIRYDVNKYVGDGFEFFVELFLHLHPVDNRVGVYGYKPNQENDNGVDGIGKNIRNEDCVVQVKYRSNTSTLLTANTDHLSNLFSDGMLSFGVISDAKEKNYRHFVFTTADGLHFYTDNEMFKGKVKCFGYKEFRAMLDNNQPFWDNVRNVVKNLVSKL